MRLRDLFTKKLSASSRLPFLALVLVSLVILPVSHRANAEDLRSFGNAPIFSLTNSQNQAFDSQTLNGKIWVVNFFFTECQGPCPIQAAHLQKLAAALPETAEVHFLSITADPVNDTPEKLAAYAARIKADTSKWHFLTGSEEKTHELMNENGFSLGSGSEPIYHSTRFVLVDKAGVIRGYFRGTEMEEVEKLEKAIKSLL